jgi:hypothetical protein
VKIVGRFGLALENLFVIRKRCHDPTEATVDGSAPRSVIFLCHAYTYLMCLIAMFIEIWSCPKSGRFTALNLWAAGPVVHAVEGFDWRTYWGRDKGMPNGWSFN